MRPHPWSPMHVDLLEVVGQEVDRLGRFRAYQLLHSHTEQPLQPLHRAAPVEPVCLDWPALQALRLGARVQ